VNARRAACGRVGPVLPHLSEVWGAQSKSWVSRPKRCAAPGCPVYTNDLVWVAGRALKTGGGRAGWIASGAAEAPVSQTPDK